MNDWNTLLGIMNYQQNQQATAQTTAQATEAHKYAMAAYNAMLVSAYAALINNGILGNGYFEDKKILEFISDDYSVIQGLRNLEDDIKEKLNKAKQILDDLKASDAV
jgi:hypothetical protein